MADVTLSMAKNGPILIKEPVTLLDENGQEIPVAKFPIALCRCGGSKNKPFCDGTHKGSFDGTCARQNTP